MTRRNGRGANKEKADRRRPGRGSEDKSNRVSKLDKVAAEVRSIKTLIGDGIERSDVLDTLEEMVSVVRGGQKRLVAVDDSRDDVVLKIAYSRDGLIDNVNEYITYDRLLELSKNEEITRDDLKLFTRIDYYEDTDPQIIVAERVSVYNEVDEFNEYYEQHKTKDLKKADLWPIFISSDENLREDHNRIMEILSDYFCASDSSLMAEPKNFGIRYEGYNMRLVLLDMGSIVPLIEAKGDKLIKPTCRCGGDLKLTVARIKKELTPNSAVTYRGSYCCNKKSCKFSDSKVGLKHQQMRDSQVFSEYIADNQEDLNELYAEIGHYYIPSDSKVCTFVDYKDAYEDEIGEIDDDHTMRVMYINFLCLSLSDILTEYDIIDLEDDIKEYDSFDEYKEEFDYIVKDCGYDLNEISDIAAVISYLKAKDSDFNVYRLLEVEDDEEFDSLVDYLDVDEDDIEDMFDYIGLILDVK